MLPFALLLMVPDRADPRERPVAAIEWVDHYSYCLESVFNGDRATRPSEPRRNAARSAAVVCWPVRASATSAIVGHLSSDDPDRSADDRQQTANRVLNLVADAFAARVGLTRSDLGPLCAPSYVEEDCGATTDP